MRQLANSIIFCSLLLFCACCSSFEEHVENNDGKLLVNLEVSVAMSDLSDAISRTSYEEAENDNEKMKTLRIVIVRQNWQVEANRLITIGDNATLKYGPEKFTVVGNEKKLIYLFVNESTTATDKSTGETRKLVDYNLNNIREGEYFPINAIESLRIRLNDNSEQILGPLPMSERHEYFVDRSEEQSCQLFVTRAAVKFTFLLINNSDNDMTLKELSVDKMAREEWYMPRAEYGEPDETTGKREITKYEVPAGIGYYTYQRNTPGQEDVTVAPKNETVLPPVYLLEGKYTDDPDSYGRNYSIGITINNNSGKYYFPELQSLPRNTHVVVKITYGNYADISCEVDVIPFSEVVLDPEYGLKREEITGYIIGKDKEGRDCWYDGNYYDPNTAVPLYLGPKDNPGKMVTINGREYMLVYGDYLYNQNKKKISGFSRTAYNLLHIIEIDGNTRKKHLLTPEGITGYTYGNDMYLNKLKQRVWLDSGGDPDPEKDPKPNDNDPRIYDALNQVGLKLYGCRILYEWDRLDWNKARYWHWLNIRPKFWFDILGNRYTWTEEDTDIEHRKTRLTEKIGAEWIPYLTDGGTDDDIIVIE